MGTFFGIVFIGTFISIYAVYKVNKRSTIRVNKRNVDNDFIKTRNAQIFGISDSSLKSIATSDVSDHDGSENYLPLFQLKYELTVQINGDNDGQYRIFRRFW